MVPYIESDVLCVAPLFLKLRGINACSTVSRAERAYELNATGREMLMSFRMIDLSRPTAFADKHFSFDRLFPINFTVPKFFLLSATQRIHIRRHDKSSDTVPPSTREMQAYSIPSGISRFRRYDIINIFDHCSIIPTAAFLYTRLTAVK